MYSLPTSVTVRDKVFTITNKGDYRVILDCFSALQDNELGEDYRVLASLLIFYNEFTCYADVLEYFDYVQDLITEMYKFFNCGATESIGAKVNYTVINWDSDEQIICSAINKVARCEVRSLPYLHWWTFMGYYNSVGESVLATVVGIRNKIMKHKPLEKWEQEFKRDNPDYFNWNSQLITDRDAEKVIRELWNKE